MPRLHAATGILMTFREKRKAAVAMAKARRAMAPKVFRAGLKKNQKNSIFAAASAGSSERLSGVVLGDPVFATVRHKVNSMTSTMLKRTSRDDFMHAAVKAGVLTASGNLSSKYR
jgi:hypothetical protein